MSLLPNTTYYYRVKALNGNQESDYSDTVSVTTLADPFALQVPVLCAIPSLHSLSVDTDKVVVHLLEPAKEEYVTEYKVTVSTNSDLSSPIHNSLTYVINTNTSKTSIDDVLVNSFTISELTSNTLYYVGIKAVNSLGQSTNLLFNFTTTPGLDSPIAIGVTNLTAITARVNWTKVKTATSYRLDVATDSNFSSLIVNNFNPGDVDYYDIPTLIENTTYYFRVRAVLGATTSLNSNTVVFTTLDAVETYNNLIYDLPTPVYSLTYRLNTTQFEVTWNKVTNAISYTLDISTSATFSSFVQQDIVTTDLKYLFTGLTANTLYYVRVKANTAAKSSAYSVKSITTLSNNVNLTVPQLLTPTVVLSSSVVLNWVKRSYATNYILQLSTVSNFASILQTVYLGDVDTYTLENLTNATTYYARLYAANNTEVSNASNTLTVATTAALPAITLQAVTELTDTSARLAWVVNASYIKYYLSVYKKINFTNITDSKVSFLGDNLFRLFSVGNISNYLLDIFLEPNSTYIYYITGETSNGDRKVSATGEFITRGAAPVIQISANGQYLEWSNSLNRLQVSTDKNFRTLVKGWNPRSVSDTKSFNISGLMKQNITYYIRGYLESNSVRGIYSNIVSTGFAESPLIADIAITKSTATVRWKSNGASSYAIQFLVDNGSNTFIAVSGFSFPVVIGNKTEYYIKDLTPNTIYGVLVSHYDQTTKTYKTTGLPAYFKTNLVDSPTEYITNGSPPVFSFSSDFDSVTITNDANDTYLVEVSRRSDFLLLEKYVEFTGFTYSVHDLKPNTDYYIRIHKKIGAEKSSPQTLTVTTTALPSFSATTTLAPVLTAATVLNINEAVFTWNTVANATGYVVEISESNTFNRLVYSVGITFLDTAKVLLSGLLGTKVYYVRVYGYSDNSIGAYSNTITIDTTP